MNSVPAPQLADDPYLALLNPPSTERSAGYRMRFALNAAVLAPSVHNTQPWRFQVHEGANAYVDLLMDPGRGLPALDPAHRQLVISCGAALAAYQVGLLGCGLLPHVETLPAALDSACLARIRVTDSGVADQAARDCWPALAQRRSFRGPMTAENLEQPQRKSLVQAAASGALLHFVPNDLWRAVEHLIAEASYELAEFTPTNAELQTWTRLAERSHDGIPAANWQRTSEQTAMAPVVQRDFAQGRPLPGAPAKRAPEAQPQLAVLFTRSDLPGDWLATGAALLHVAVCAQQQGIALGYVNQPTEVPGLREKLGSVLAADDAELGVPQLVLRLGHPAMALPPPTPRRPVQEVLVP